VGADKLGYLGRLCVQFVTGDLVLSAAKGQEDIEYTDFCFFSDYARKQKNKRCVYLDFAI